MPPLSLLSITKQFNLNHNLGNLEKYSNDTKYI